MLHLYLAGACFQSKEVTLHDNADDLTWEDNCEIRQIQLAAAIQTFRISYLRQIIKTGHTDEVAVIFKSKIQSHDTEHDFS